MTENTACRRLRRAASGAIPVRYNREQVKYSMLTYFARLRQLEEAQRRGEQAALDSLAYGDACEDSAFKFEKRQFSTLKRKRIAASDRKQTTYLDQLKQQTECCADLFESLPHSQARTQSCARKMHCNASASEDEANPNYEIGKVLFVKRRHARMQQTNVDLVRSSTELLLPDVISQLAVRHQRALGRRTAMLRCAAHQAAQHRYIPLDELEAQKRAAKEDTQILCHLFGYVDVSICTNQALVHVKNGRPRALLTLGAKEGEGEAQRFLSFGRVFSCEQAEFGFAEWDALKTAAHTSVFLGERLQCESILLDHVGGVFLPQPELRSLILANIDFEGELGAEECCLDVCIAGLQDLVIFNCVFRRLLLTAPELRNLHVSNTSDRGKISSVQLVGPDFGLHFTQLRTASFLGCDVSGINFSAAESLRSLSFRSSQRVPRLDSAVVTSGLQSLDCSASSLRLQPHLAFCTQLTLIKLSGSRITTIDCCNLPLCLQELQCSSTGLRQLKNAQVLEKLTVLQLSRNELQRIEHFPLALKSVDLAESGILSLNGLENHAGLEALDVSWICQVETDFWFLSENLRELRAQNCSIGILPDLRHFEHLSALFLDGNKGIQINHITLPDSLQILSLSACDLQEMFDMSRFKSVQMLDLSYNAGIELSYDCLPSHVTCLKLQGCQLQEVYFRGSTVDVICLEGNSLSFFCPLHSECKVISEELFATSWGIFVRAHQKNVRLRVAKKLLEVYDRYSRLAWLQAHIGSKL